MNEIKPISYRGYQIIFDNKEGYFYITDSNNNIVKDQDNDIVKFYGSASAYSYIQDLENNGIKTLPDFLEELDIKEEDEDAAEGIVEELISEKMPGYKIYTWNTEVSGIINFAEEYTSIIGHEVNQGHQIEDIQFSEWVSNGNRTVLVVIAIKIK